MVFMLSIFVEIINTKFLALLTSNHHGMSLGHEVLLPPFIFGTTPQTRNHVENN